MALLISGHMGSGKSVLCKTLHAPPDIIIMEGFYCFSQLNVSYRKHIRGLKRVDKYRNFCHAGVRLGFLYYLLWLRVNTLNGKSVGLKEVEDTFKRIFPKAVIIGDAATRYLGIMGTTINLPGVRHIVIYRDCRDVVAEMHQRVIKEHNDLISEEQKLDLHERTARRWVNMIEIMNAYQGKIYTIRYEDLVSQPDLILYPLAQWLGLASNQYRYDFLHIEHIGEYKKILTKNELNRVLNIAGPTMERLEYL